MINSNIPFQVLHYVIINKINQTPTVRLNCAKFWEMTSLKLLKKTRNWENNYWILFYSTNRVFF